MNQKTISELGNLSRNGALLLKYTEVFHSSMGPKVSIEIAAGESGLDWTEKIPPDIFKEIKNETLSESFLKAKEAVGKMTNNCFTIDCEYLYRKNGTRTIEYGIHVADVGHFYADNCDSVVEQLEYAIEVQKIRTRIKEKRSSAQ